MMGFHYTPNYFCHCGRIFAPGEIHCSRYASGVPTREHRTRSMALNVFQPYVDHNISVDGQPVLVTSEAHLRRLMRNQWDGDNQAKIEKKHNPEADYRSRHWKEYLEAKRNG